VSQIPDNADLQYLMNPSGTISQTQFVYTVKQLGFSDTTAFRVFQNKQISLQSYLHSKYFSGDTIPSMSIPLGIAYPNQSLCAVQYTSCMHQASQTYTFHILECTGRAVSIGAVGFGIGGLIFQLGCGATSIHYLNQDRHDCAAGYKACRGY
jgi:hypothetical protein